MANPTQVLCLGRVWEQGELKLGLQGGKLVVHSNQAMERLYGVWGER